MRASSFLLLIAALFLALPACGSVEVIDNLSGTVVDEEGAPAADVRVKVGDSLVTTDAAGHFTVSAVSSPYDVVLIPKDTQNPYVFLGLTGSDPTLKVYDRQLNPAGQSSTILLDLPVDPAAHEQFSFIVDRPDDLSPFEVTNANPTADGHVLITVSWPEGQYTNVRIQALRYTVDGSGLQHYTGYDTVTMPVPGGLAAAWTASWKAPSFKEAKLSVSVGSAPDGYEIWQTEVSMRPGGGPAGGGVAWSSSHDPNQTFVVPALEGAAFDVTVCASNAESSSCRTVPGLAAGAHAQMTMDEGPALLSPATGESVGAGSEVQWSAPGEGTSFLLFYPPSGAPGPWYFIATGDESATIPDLTALGTKLPSGADYNLGVFHNGADATVDDLAKNGPFFGSGIQASTYAYSNTITVKTR